jgi:drug/metabolite transporter (DMT)-like permease
MKIVLYTGFALIAFALNSILCRMALGSGEADAASFTAVRLASGAMMLAIIAASLWKTKKAVQSGHWASAFFLFLYAIAFSFAYLGLNAGTGALILFGSVQITMVTAALVRGERPGALEWAGLIAAVGGLIYLVLPGLSSPPLISSLLMAAAGAAWGFYTLRGKGSEDPIADTAGNFLRSVPMIAVVAAVMWPQMQITLWGFVLAVLSGALASGLGYTVWYAALRFHTPTRTAVLQLAVPVLVALLGIAMLGETATLRLAIAGTLILGGIGLTSLRRGSKS